MAAPTAGSFLLTSNYDTLQNQITNIENAGAAGGQSNSSANGTTSSTSYTSSLSAGGTQAVTVTLAAGQTCLVGVYCEGNSATANAGLRISFAVSGAATEAAVDNRGGTQSLTATTQTTSFGRTTLYTAPSAGSYTFTANYKVAAGTGSFNQRTLFAQPQPYNS